MDRNAAHDRRALRSAEWRGASRMLGAIASFLLLAAVIYPVLGQHHFSGPEKVPPSRIANAIQTYRRETEAWPDSLQPVRRALRMVSFALNPHIAFLPLRTDAQGADYVICVDGNLEEWRIPVESKPQRIGARAFSGVLHPEA